MRKAAIFNIISYESYDRFFINLMLQKLELGEDLHVIWYPVQYTDLERFPYATFAVSTFLHDLKKIPWPIVSPKYEF